MVSRRLKIQIVALFGTAVAFYAWYVETMMDADPMYVPACNSAFFGGSCGTVFKSSYGHILSHWGIVPKSHALDLSLAITGILLYSAYFVAISVRVKFPFREQLFLAVALAGAIFSCYLLYVIKFILKDFCIVCASFHVCNFSMLVLAVLEYRNPEVTSRKRKSR